jgi:hypothetical protein
MENDKKPASAIGDPAELFEGRDGKGRFQSGPHPDRKGRPRGSRNKLTEAFLADLNDLWQEQGPAIMRRAAFESPMKFADMVARLLPAKIEVKTESPFADWDHERLTTMLQAVTAWKDALEARPETPLIDVTPKQEPDDAA